MASPATFMSDHVSGISASGHATSKSTEVEVNVGGASTTANVKVGQPASTTTSPPVVGSRYAQPSTSSTPAVGKGSSGGKQAGNVVGDSTGELILKKKHAYPTSRAKRRKLSDTAEDDRWYCCNRGCTTLFKRTSTSSIKQHQARCPFKNLVATHPRLSALQLPFYPPTGALQFGMLPLSASQQSSAYPYAGISKTIPPAVPARHQQTTYQQLPHYYTTPGPLEFVPPQRHSNAPPTLGSCLPQVQHTYQQVAHQITPQQ